VGPDCCCGESIAGLQGVNGPICDPGKPLPVKVGICSGYFACGLHEGYLDLFNAILANGEKLIVIVNNDKQTEKKYGFVPISASKRKAMIDKYPGITNTVISVDDDESVAFTLGQIVKDCICAYKLTQFSFYNSGDRTIANVNKREQIACSNWGIEMKYLDMPKLGSSSELIKKISDEAVNRFLDRDNEPSWMPGSNMTTKQFTSLPLEVANKLLGG
jgi:bifunctional ADP-heptose synthase (sugar kinase/adenylyltransferase)